MDLGIMKIGRKWDPEQGGIPTSSQPQNVTSEENDVIDLGVIQ